MKNRTRWLAFVLLLVLFITPAAPAMAADCNELGIPNAVLVSLGLSVPAGLGGASFGSGIGIAMGGTAFAATGTLAIASALAVALPVAGVWILHETEVIRIRAQRPRRKPLSNGSASTARFTIGVCAEDVVQLIEDLQARRRGLGENMRAWLAGVGGKLRDLVDPPVLADGSPPSADSPVHDMPHVPEKSMLELIFPPWALPHVPWGSGYVIDVLAAA